MLGRSSTLRGGLQARMALTEVGAVPAWLEYQKWDLYQGNEVGVSAAIDRLLKVVGKLAKLPRPR